MKRPIYKQWWFWALIAALVLVNILSPTYGMPKGSNSAALQVSVPALGSNNIRPTNYDGVMITKKYLSHENERYFILDHSR